MGKLVLTVNNKEEQAFAAELIKAHPDKIARTTIKAGNYLVESKIGGLAKSKLEPLMTLLNNPDGTLTFFFDKDELYVKNGRIVKLVNTGDTSKVNNNLTKFFNEIRNNNIPDYVILLSIFGTSISDAEITDITGDMPDITIANINTKCVDLLRKNKSKGYTKLLAECKKSLSVGKYTKIIMK